MLNIVNLIFLATLGILVCE